MQFLRAITIKWIAVIWFFGIVSCQYSSDTDIRNNQFINSSEYHDEEIRVINDLFHDLIGNYFHITPPVQTNDSITDIQLMAEYESERKLIGDTILALIYDTLFVHSKPEYKNAEWIAQLSLNNTFKDLITDSLQTNKKLDLNRISHPKNYKLISARLERGMPIIQISRMAFNKEFTKGVFYHGILHHGYLVFVEKLNNKWKVVHRELLWVS